MTNRVWTFHNRIVQAEAMLRSRGIAPRRIELTDADWLTLYEEMRPMMRYGILHPFGKLHDMGYCTYLGMHMVEAVDDFSALCWRWPHGEPPRLRVIGWERERIQ